MPLRQQVEEMPSVNLTSMIDVLFLLIIFFMVATTFGDLERNLELQVPEVSETGDTRPPAQPLVINVFGDGRIEFENETATIEELTTRLTAVRSQRGDPSVIIRGDATCAFQHIASALAACRAAHISELGITVRTASLPGQTTR